MAETSQVVIVGGGVAGCSVAYHLALAGVKATVIEREGIGTQASGFSAGGLNPLEGANIPGLLGPLAIESYRMHLKLWDQLKEETGIDYEGRINSLVKVAFDESEIPQLQESLDIFSEAQQDGFSAKWLDRKEIEELEPRISSEVVQGLQAYGNAALDSYKYTLALATAAEKRGAVIRSGSVNGFKIHNGRVTSVLFGDNEIECEQVVLATGPWSREVEPWLDISLPVDPLKGEILRLALPGAPLTSDFTGGGGSLYPKPDGLVWCGTTEEWQGFDKQPSESAKQSIMQGAIRIMPDLAQGKLVLHTACLRPVTPDWLPIVGWAPGWDNVFLTTGAGKKGILLSPGMGKATADLLTEGQTYMPVGPCSPQRFSLTTSAPPSAGDDAGN
ncbi:MAG: NAD(P)/FAD-dependent oxidoreductase [Dehalococcoidia bacterium]